MTDPPQTEQPVQLAVSNAMVKLYKEQFGRGPTKARTTFAGPDLIICTLEDSLTAAERNLVALGQHDRLRDVRMFFQHAAADKFRAIVEEHTCRRRSSISTPTGPPRRSVERQARSSPGSSDHDTMSSGSPSFSM
jgi:uncharacterized protein YbcI